MGAETGVARGGFLESQVDVASLFTREDLSEEQRLFGRTAAEFMRREVLPHEARLFAHDWLFVRDLLRKAGQLDLLRLEIPVAYGGLGVDRASAAFVGEQIAASPSFGSAIGVHTAIGTLPLVYFGDDAQKARYLPRLASGELIAAYALTEPHSGSDALAARTTAVLDADGRHYVLNGQKAWITNGGFADLFTVFAKVDGRHFTAFLVERGMGVKSGPNEKKLGLDGSSTAALMFDDVRVPIANVVGAVGEGHKVAFNTLNIGRVKLGARNMAAAKMVMRQAVQYARERRQFGRAIAEFGLIRQKLAGMAVRAFVGDAMTYRTLGDVDRELAAVRPEDGAAVLAVLERYAVECSINKVWTSEALGWITDEAVQVFGGNGYSREFPVERAYRDARITRIYEGTNEINRLLIPGRLLKDGYGAARGSSAPAPPAAVGDGLAAEWAAIGAGKRLALALLQATAAACGDQLRHEQELVGHIADVIIELYASESALGRCAKHWLPRADDRAALATAIVRISLSDALDRIRRLAGELIVSLCARGTGQELSAHLAALDAYPRPDLIALRRRVADSVVASEGDLF